MKIRLFDKTCSENSQDIFKGPWGVDSMLLLYAGCQENRTFKGKEVQFQKKGLFIYDKNLYDLWGTNVLTLL